MRQPVLLHFYRDDYYLNPFWVSMAYCFFAFMLTLMREIVKDMEDSKGDAAEGCTTLPIKLGLQRTARITQVLCIVTILALLCICYYTYAADYYLLAAYTGLFIVVPMTVWLFYLPRKNTIAHYNSASRWLKVIMLAGIGSLVIYHVHVNGIVCTE
jgi:4-hydroxybenzoate polyprenyltransferase